MSINKYLTILYLIFPNFDKSLIINSKRLILRIFSYNIIATIPIEYSLGTKGMYIYYNINAHEIISFVNCINTALPILITHGTTKQGVQNTSKVRVYTL